jgi:hypothetical protein
MSPRTRTLRPFPGDAERLAAVEQRLADHEARCEERLAEIRASAAHTLQAVEGLKSRILAICLSLLAWALAQLWAADHVSPVPGAVAAQEAAHGAGD